MIIRTTLSLLMKYLTRDMVIAALEAMKGGPSAEADGMPTELYQQFPHSFAPRML